MKTVEELIRDRYKVIADYFYSPYKVGDIITVLYHDRSIHLTTTHYRDEFGETVDQANHFNPARLKDYPHLFQPLPWWSDRKVEDMPAFVKGGGYYYKHEYCITDGKLMFNQYCNGHPIGWLPVNKEFDFYTPVSDEEYELFKHPHL